MPIELQDASAYASRPPSCSSAALIIRCAAHWPIWEMPRLSFAGVLSELGLPLTELLPAVLSFNVGVEAGQLTVIGLAFLALGLPWRTAPWYRRRIAVPASLAIAAVGLYWSVERILL